MLHMHDNIARLRVQIHKKTGIPPGHQQLTLSKWPLQGDEKILSKCGINDTSTVHITDTRGMRVVIVSHQDARVRTGLIVPPSITIKVLHERVARVTGLKADTFWLTYQHYLLISSCTLETYGMQHDSAIKLHMRIRGGNMPSNIFFVPGVYDDIDSLVVSMEDVEQLVDELFNADVEELDDDEDMYEEVDSQATTVKFEPCAYDTVSEASYTSGNAHKRARIDDGTYEHTPEETPPPSFFAFAVRIITLAGGEFEMWVQPYTTALDA